MTESGSECEEQEGDHSSDSDTPGDECPELSPKQARKLALKMAALMPDRAADKVAVLKAFFALTAIAIVVHQLEGFHNGKIGEAILASLREFFDFTKRVGGQSKFWRTARSACLSAINGESMLGYGRAFCRLVGLKRARWEEAGLRRKQAMHQVGLQQLTKMLNKHCD